MSLKILVITLIALLVFAVPLAVLGVIVSMRVKKRRKQLEAEANSAKGTLDGS